MQSLTKVNFIFYNIEGQIHFYINLVLLSFVKKQKVNVPTANLLTLIGSIITFMVLSVLEHGIFFTVLFLKCISEGWRRKVYLYSLWPQHLNNVLQLYLNTKYFKKSQQLDLNIQLELLVLLVYIQLKLAFQILLIVTNTQQLDLLQRDCQRY